MQQFILISKTTDETEKKTTTLFALTIENVGSIIRTVTETEHFYFESSTFAQRVTTKNIFDDDGKLIGAYLAPMQ